MSSRKDREIERLMQGAHADRRCLAPKDQSLRRACARRAEKGMLVEPFKGLFADEASWNHLGRREQELMVVRGLAQSHPDWAFCHASAALLHDLPISYRLLRPVHVVATRKDRRRAYDGVRYHTSRSWQTTSLGGIRVTTLRRTVVDNLLTLGFPDALAIADAFLRTSGTGREELVEMVRRVGRRRHGIKRALATAGQADARAESGGESIARAVISQLGFAPPDLQVKVANPTDPLNPYRIDFAWTRPDGMPVFGELDGLDKYVDPGMTKGRDIARVMADERLRESHIVAMTGGLMMRFSYQTVRRPREFERLLASHGIPRIASPCI